MQRLLWTAAKSCHGTECVPRHATYMRTTPVTAVMWTAYTLRSYTTPLRTEPSLHEVVLDICILLQAPQTALLIPNSNCLQVMSAIRC